MLLARNYMLQPPTRLVNRRCHYHYRFVSIVIAMRAIAPTHLRLPHFRVIAIGLRIYPHRHSTPCALNASTHHPSRRTHRHRPE
jgi:hypothetical protein